VTQLFHHPEGDPAASMDGHAGGLIEHQQGFILIDNGKAARRHAPGLARVRQPQWRHADEIPRGEPIIGSDATFIYTHLATSYRFVKMAFWHALALAQKKVVDALASLLSVDFDKTHARGLRGL